MILEELRGKTKDEMLAVLHRVEKEQSEMFMKDFIPCIRKDFDKGLCADFDFVLKLCLETFRCGFLAGMLLNMPE